jgi:nucleotide-binding universal stress UspA family protein
MLPDPGSQLDGFTVGPLVHTGGMAVLYDVTRPGAEFPLLMKVPRLGHGEPAENMVTFEMEQTVLAALQGPHAPRLVAAGGLDRQPYLVMERIDGRSLREWVDAAPLAAEEVARLGAAVATALHSLHAQDCVHLDVKPSNVIIRPDGEAVMVDFGLAHHGSYPDLMAEELRGPAGSAPYVSPEAVLGGRSDPRSDLFSLGAVLYQLATGALPFGSPTSRSGLRKRLYRDPVPPRALVEAVPEWLQEVILRCLEPDARDRYPSAAHLAFDLSNPAAVAITARGRRTRRAPPWKVLARWVRAAGAEPAEPLRPSAQLSSAAIVLVAISTRDVDDAYAEGMRDAVRRALATAGQARLACVTVIPPTPELGGSTDEETAGRQRLKQLVRLRHFVEPLGLSAEQVSLHVLASGDPARAILGYVRANHVDHVVMGAPPRRLPAAAIQHVVSMQVAAAAPCTVTLVRVRAAADDEPIPPPWPTPL